MTHPNRDLIFKIIDKKSFSLSLPRLPPLLHLASDYICNKKKVTFPMKRRKNTSA